jgi:hypothetical protein
MPTSYGFKKGARCQPITDANASAIDERNTISPKALSIRVWRMCFLRANGLIQHFASRCGAVPPLTPLTPLNKGGM